MNSEAVMEAIRQREKCRIAIASLKDENPELAADHPMMAEINRLNKEMKTHGRVIRKMEEMVRLFYNNQASNCWYHSLLLTETGIDMRCVEEGQDRDDVSQYPVTVAWDEFWQEWVLSKLSE